MSVKVCFLRPGLMGSIDAVAMGKVRISETIALDATTTASAQDGEIAVLMSTEAGPYIAAHGATPSAAATAETAATSAGYGVPTGIPFPVAVKTGDKFQVKAFA